MSNVPLFDLISESKVEQLLKESVSQSETPLFLLDTDGRILLVAKTNNNKEKFIDKIQSIDGLSRIKENEQILTFSYNESSKLYAKSIFRNGKCLGAIASCQQGNNGYARQLAFLTARRLEDLANSTSDIDNLSAEIVRNYEEINFLYDVSRMLGGVIRPDRACEIILQQAMQTIGAKKASIMLLDEETNELYISTARGIAPQIISTERVKVGEGICGLVAENGKALLVNDAAQYDALKGKTSPERYETESFLSFPLLISPMKVNKEVLGVINMTDKASRENFTTSDQQLLEAIATQAAVAIKNGKLYEHLKRLFVDTVEALVSTIDAKDPYTHGHARRVAQTSITISKQLGLSDESIEEVQLAALLHDIGKIGVPESVLLKPSKLDDKEWAQMRMHPECGAQIIQHISLMNPDIIDGVKHHHERQDGTGYPDRLAQNAIPSIARIISVADAFDAMISDRPYRKAMSEGDAIMNLNRSSGSQLDNNAVEAFLAAYN
jgi:HD-GYP domain-containing protein (c-di-GMP phosphodiesterase class II)